MFLVMLLISLSGCLRTPITTCKVDTSLIVFEADIKRPRGKITNGDLANIIRKMARENKIDNKRKQQLLKQLRTCK